MRKRLVTTAVAVAMIAGGSSWAGATAASAAIPREARVVHHGDTNPVVQQVAPGATTQDATAAATTDIGHILASGTQMDGPTQNLSSASGQFEIFADGELGDEVGLYWNSYSSGIEELSVDPFNGGHHVLAMQSDGNLVLYTNGGNVTWAANTEGNPGAQAVLQNDGNFVVYSSTGTVLWASATFANGMFSFSDGEDEAVTFLAPQWYLANNRYILVMQGDGNLVLYSPTRAVWASNTNGNPGAVAVLQGDGNLVVYSETGTALWANGQNRGEGLYLLDLEPDGNLVETRFSPTGNISTIWATRTAGAR